MCEHQKGWAQYLGARPQEGGTNSPSWGGVASQVSLLEGTLD